MGRNAYVEAANLHLNQNTIGIKATHFAVVEAPHATMTNHTHAGASASYQSTLILENADISRNGTGILLNGASTAHLTGTTYLNNGSDKDLGEHDRVIE